MMMMRGNCNRSSGPSNCVWRSSPASSNFKASRQKVAPPRKRNPLSVLMQQGIQRMDTKELSKKLEDADTPVSLKREIKLQIETRRHDEDDATAAAAEAVILEKTPQLPPKPARASPWLIEKLYDKRGPERAKALAGVVEVLKKKLDHEDLIERYVVELLYRCLSSLKKGSTKEVQNALQVIGLLSITIDCEEKLSEIYREFLQVASASACLKKSGTNTTKMLECLGVVTFFGAVGAEETQNGMKVIWDFLMSLKSESGSDDPMRKKQSQEILVAAIYSWCFLLTSTDGWRLNQNWRGAISFFMDILDNNHDVLVHGAASAALALIFETDALEKFWDGANDSTLPYSQLRETLREMILNKLSSLNMNANVVEYFNTLECPISRPTVCEKKLELSSWYQVIQLAFLKSFLGKEFENFMTKEEKMQSFFEFNPNSNDYVGEELFEPTIEKISVNMVIPEGRDPQSLTAEQRKKERVLRTSIQGKAKTLLRTKHRLMSEELNCFD